ncbi:RNA-binding domain-containing protein [Stygiolobus caldivivus]|uniref:Exosome protein n=1 Tax=Stygiolobus caldivivus TaxID=2824673 RepID=A0A8D5U6T1_9CREN|nr:RNA-binding domain-containing protein [Stygiolobus caldivivus]BCU70616.1 hypothetical protein KN1_19130 [Stygiolobus caldivivus]
MKVAFISISVFCHETEDRNKILSSLESFFSLNNAEVKDSIVQGHYGNKIEIIEYKMKGKEAQNIFEKVLSSLDKVDLILLVSTLQSRTDKGKLHLRIDKQRLIEENKIFLRDGDDVVKLIVSFRNFRNSNEIIEELKNLASRDMRENV